LTYADAVAASEAIRAGKDVMTTYVRNRLAIALAAALLTAPEKVANDNGMF